jgi:hypothetical protein
MFIGTVINLQRNPHGKLLTAAAPTINAVNTKGMRTGIPVQMLIESETTVEMTEIQRLSIESQPVAKL